MVLVLVVIFNFTVRIFPAKILREIDGTLKILVVRKRRFENNQSNANGNVDCVFLHCFTIARWNWISTIVFCGIIIGIGKC